jgi:hypothetical protein
LVDIPEAQAAQKKPRGRCRSPNQLGTQDNMGDKLHQVGAQQLSPVKRPSPHRMPFSGPLGIRQLGSEHTSTGYASAPSPPPPKSVAYKLQDNMPSRLCFLRAYNQEDNMEDTLHHISASQLSPVKRPSPHVMPFSGPLGTSGNTASSGDPGKQTGNCEHGKNQPQAAPLATQPQAVTQLNKPGVENPAPPAPLATKP